MFTKCFTQGDINCSVLTTNALMLFIFAILIIHKSPFMQKVISRHDIPYSTFKLHIDVFSNLYSLIYMQNKMVGIFYVTSVINFLNLFNSIRNCIRVYYHSPMWTPCARSNHSNMNPHVSRGWLHSIVRKADTQSLYLLNYTTLYEQCCHLILSSDTR